MAEKEGLDQEGREQFSNEVQKVTALALQLQTGHASIQHEAGRRLSAALESGEVCVRGLEPATCPHSPLHALSRHH